MTSININPKEFNPYYSTYIDKALNMDIVQGLKENLDTVTTFYKTIPKEKHSFSYDAGKWTIKDILLHLIDTERIFVYRALRILRDDKTALAGFDQDEYVLNGKANGRSMESLLSEYRAVRTSTIALYKEISEQELLKTGEASGSIISIRAIGYILTGHENHHNQIIKERYL